MADDDYIGGRVVAATVFGLLLPVTAIAVRIYVKARSSVDPRTRTEDWLAYAALFFKIGLDVDGIIRRSCDAVTLRAATLKCCTQS